MGTAGDQTTKRVGVCIYCEQAVEQAEDGAWEDEKGGCGCTVSYELGGAGEHEADEPTVITTTTGRV